jgi:hypothetical protein
VRYTPDWEPLADALRRVIARGGSEEEAKADISRAVGDGNIRLRVTLAKSDYGGAGEVFCDGNVRVPAQLSTGDLDWERSRPLRSWKIGPMDGQHYEWVGGWQDRPVNLIELSTADVMRVLCGPQDHPAIPCDPGRPPRPVRDRSRPALERASRIISELYPEGIPDQATLPNTVLCRRVGDRLKSDGLPKTSDDSILRAAGRRK